MAGKSAVPLDEVIIEIKSKADGSTKSIDELAASLNNLKQSISGGFNNLDKLSKTLGELPTLMNKFDTTTFENLKRVSNELAQSLEPLANKMNQIAQGYSAFSKIQNTFGKSASTSTRYMKQQKSMLVALSNVARRSVSSFVKLGSSISTGFGKKAVSDIKKFNSQFKQILLSLLGTRTLFTMIRKAAAEYEAFDETLQKFSTNVWRAFGAQLAPIIEYTMELFKQFVRVIYSIVYALTGIDLIAKANAKAMAAWGKSSKDTLGNLQKFDDLNVVEFDKNKSGDDKSLIELDKIDLSPIQKVIDWVRKLKKEIQEAWNSGEWYGVGEVFAEGVNQGIAFILKNMESIRDKLFSIANDFGQLLNGYIEKTNWREIGKLISESVKTVFETIEVFLQNLNGEAIGKAFDSFIKGFDGAGIVSRIMWAIKTGILKIQEALFQLDYTKLGEDIGKIFITFFYNFNDIIDKVDWKQLGKNLRTTLENIPWKTIWDNAVKLFKTALTGLGEFFQGLLNIEIDAESIGKGALTIGTIVVALIGLKKIMDNFTSTKKTAEDVAKNFSGMFESLGKAAGTIALLGGLALVIKEITGLIESFAQTGLSAKEGLLLIGGALAAIALGFTLMAGATNAMDWTGIAGAVVLLGGLALVINQLTGLFEVFSKSGLSLGESLGFMAGVLAIALAGLGGLALIGKALASDPLLLLGVAAALLAIGAFLEIIKSTLPTILDACGKFIDTVAPHIIKLIDTIGGIINNIIHSLGDVLPPIINSIGGLFTRVFNGIAQIINTVGNVIIKIMNTSGNVIDRVLRSILTFINELGPAINRFVDNAIIAITKLINFVVSAVEFLINTAIIKPINKLINKINNNAIADKLGWQISTFGIVSIDRFVPKLATGTNEIPYEGIYHLHPGEAVVPKKYNPALGGGTNAETNEKLDRLIFIMENMDFTNVVNIGNERVYAGQQKFNKYQQNKYGTINIY